MQPKLPFGGGGPDRLRGGGGDQPPTKVVLTVKEAVEAANRCLERSIAPTWVEGELANLSLPASGHAYFSLKDPDAVLPVVIWRGAVQRLRFRLEVGARVRLFGRMGIYTASGRFQFYAERGEPAGVGDLMLQLEQLKQKLGAEGLFAAERKRPLPTWPRIIGVVTSPSGAVIHDILRVVRRRRPSHVLLAPARVQGPEAVPELVAALGRLQRVAGIDVIILCRGGGSFEDLWCFNDERLARAVAACSVPVVSAVGHELDVSICDLVADLRAATPSQAGELVVPDCRVLVREIASMMRRMRLEIERDALDARTRLDAAAHRLERRGRALLRAQRARADTSRRRIVDLGHRLTRDRRSRLLALEARLSALHPRERIRRDRARLARCEAGLARASGASSSAYRVRLARAAGQLQGLSPLAVLERGYALVSREDGTLLRDARSVHAGTRLGVRLHEGELVVEVVEHERDPLGGRRRGAP